MKIDASKRTGVLESFAKQLGTTYEHGKVVIPPKYGQGFLHGFFFDEQIRLMIRNYEVNEDFVIKRTFEQHAPNLLFFQFQYITSSVQITTQGINAEMLVPRNIRQQSITMLVDAGYLTARMGAQLNSPILQTILENRQPLFFEQLISPALQQIMQQMMRDDIPLMFHQYYFRVKAEELIGALFMELVKREEVPVYSLNVADIKAIYKVKDALVSAGDTFPSIPVLVKMVNMSESKMKRLFKQVFGTNIFNYYQSVRMQEAARLLSEEKLSVSEVGYKLGFSNMSHFTRAFEEYIGMKPKKYSMLHSR